MPLQLVPHLTQCLPLVSAAVWFNPFFNNQFHIWLNAYHCSSFDLVHDLKIFTIAFWLQRTKACSYTKRMINQSYIIIVKIMFLLCSTACTYWSTSSCSSMVLEGLFSHHYGAIISWVPWCCLSWTSWCL